MSWSCFQLHKEELDKKQEEYQRFLESGHKILERSDPDSPEAEGINEQIDHINRVWDNIERKLGERESHLKDMLQMSSQFSDQLKHMSEWLPEMTERLERLPPVSTQPEIIADQREQLKVC